MFRVLHVMSALAPTSGGTTEALKGLAAEQARRGLSVTVAVTDRGNPVSERLKLSYFQGLYDGAVTIRAFPVSWPALLWSPTMRTWLRKHAAEFDLMHVHGLYRFPPTYAAREARRQRMPYVITPHGALDPYMYDKSTAGSIRLKRLYERWFDMPNLNAADAIHFTTQDEQERAAFLGLRARSFVAPIGVDWRPFRVLPERGALRRCWGVGQRPIALFLGRLHFKKGLDLLIPAFDTVRREVPDAQLVIAGPDNDGYGETVRTWVRERGLGDCVHLVGPLFGDDVVQAYVDADVFVLPSYTENFGMTVLEAMASELPVVISDQVNIHREVTGAEAGLVTRCDVDEVAAALVSLLRVPRQRQVMGEAGRRLVRERYTWPAVVDALTQEYEAVLERHRQTARR